MRELPIFAAFGHSVRSTINNLPFAFHASWPWMLLLLPINLAGNIYTVLNFVPPADPTKYWESMSPDIVAVNIGMAAAAFVAFASIAVSWHRYVLLDEVPQGLARLRLDSTVWRYVGNAVLIAITAALGGFLILIVPGLFAGVAIAATGMGGLIVAVPIVCAGLILAFGLSMRLSVKLPAIAMDNRAITMGVAMDVTRDNHWRVGTLFFLVMLCLLAIGFTISLLTNSLAGGGSTVGLTTLVVVQMAVNWISTIWNVTLLTSLYGFFIEKRTF